MYLILMLLYAKAPAFLIN